MSKQVYISADYAEDSGDKNVVNLLQKWGRDDKHKTEFIDMSEVVSGSVAADPDCRPCDLKAEFNRQINASSTVIFIVGDKTSIRTAGSKCERSSKEWYQCSCTPYKQNTNGTKTCKCYNTTTETNGNVGNINQYSYLRHEFEQTKKKGKNFIILYNSTRYETSWLPFYMTDYKRDAYPFWKINIYGEKVGDYDLIKQALGYD